LPLPPPPRSDPRSPPARTALRGSSTSTAFLGDVEGPGTLSGSSMGGTQPPTPRPPPPSPGHRSGPRPVLRTGSWQGSSAVYPRPFAAFIFPNCVIQSRSNSKKRLDLDTVQYILHVYPSVITDGLFSCIYLELQPWIVQTTSKKMDTRNISRIRFVENVFRPRIVSLMRQSDPYRGVFFLLSSGSSNHSVIPCIPSWNDSCVGSV
jgi:hypothetical protein